MPISVALSLLLFAFRPQGISTISDFTNVNGDSLKARYDSAMSQGRRGTDDTFWIAYEMPARPNVRVNTVDGIDVVYRNNPDRLAMFMLIRKSDGAIDRL